MSDWRQQQEQDEQEHEILGVLNKVAMGIAGEPEARVIAAALGINGFTNRGNGDTDE